MSKKLTKDQLDSDVVKSLLGAGFEEDVIAGWIKQGRIDLNKSLEDGEEDDDDDEDNGGEEIGKSNSDDEDLGEDPDDEDEDDEDDDEDLGEDPDDENGDDDNKKDEKIVKSISRDIVKSINREIQEMNEEFAKSVSSAIGEVLKPFTEDIKKSLRGMREAISQLGNTAPGFKSGNINRAVIEKSLGGRDENDKTVLSVSSNRQIVKSLMEKMISEEKDEDLQKSLLAEAQSYLIDPIYGTVGENVARYMYEHGVRLVK